MWNNIKNRLQKDTQKDLEKSTDHSVQANNQKKVRKIGKINSLKGKQLGFFLVFLLLAIIAMGYGFEKVRTEYLHTVYRASDTQVMPDYEKNTYYRVDFALEKDCKLDGIHLAYKNVDPENARGTMEVVVKLTREDGTEVILATQDMDAEDIPSWGWVSVMFDETCDYVAGQQITITSTAMSDWRKANSITSICAEEGMLALKVSADYWDIVQIAYLVFCALLAAVFVLCYLALFVFHWKTEHIFAIAVTCGCLLFGLLIPPYHGVDEGAHCMQVFEVAEKMQGMADEDAGTSAVTEAEAETYVSEGAPTHDDYKTYYTNLLKKSDKTEWTTRQNYNMFENSDLLFVMPAAGTVLGRTLHLSGEGIFMLGRIFNFIQILLLLFYAMKRSPFGKELIFALCMMPITLQQMATINPDGILLALSLAVLAGCMRLCEDTWDKWVVLDLAVVVCSALLLSVCKYGALVPICMIPVVLFAKKRKHTEKKHRVVAWGALGLTAACIVCGFIPLITKAFSSYSDSLWSNYYTVSDILADPAKFFLIFLNTLYVNGDFYMLTLGGHYLGWMNIILPETVAFAYLMLLFFAAIPTKKESGILNGKDRMWFFLIGLFGVGFAFGGMLIGWTPNDIMQIEGVQGRYFLPFILPLIFALRGKNICVDDEGVSRNKMVMLSMWLLILSVVCLFVRM